MYFNDKKCELLAPAGSKEAFISAVECGADAVYIGGRLFNARINASNFHSDQLERAVDFAHTRGVRVYVTMNTLIFDNEIKEALQYGKALRKIGVDALILQDLGLAHMFRHTMPDMALHLSTQGSVYDRRGVEMARDLGFERVVTARELSLKEIEQVCQVENMEIETFVHGAICLCYSGQCQMSRYMGGRSGNRGACAQPCRHKYGATMVDGRSKGQSHWLSPSDLNLLDNIGYLIDAGVSSLKIEGRMKSPEYVAIVVSIYRKYMDIYYRTGSFTVSDDDALALEQIFNRGGFTKAYMDGKQPEDFFSTELPKHWGVKVGTVTKGQNISKNKGQSVLVEATIDKGQQLMLGDGIEIRGGGFASNVLTYMEKGKKTTVLGDFKTQVQPGDVIYRVTSKEQQKLAKLTYEGKDWDQGKFSRKSQVDISLSVKSDHSGATIEASAKAKILDRTFETAKAVVPLELRQDGSSNPLAPKVEKSLLKTGNTPFEVQVKWYGPEEGPYQIKASQLNELRRSLLSELQEQITEGFKVHNDEMRSTLESYMKNLETVTDLSRDHLHNPFGSEGKVLELYYLNPESFVSHNKISQIYRCCEEMGVEVRSLLPLAYVLNKANEVAFGATHKLDTRGLSSDQLSKLQALMEEIGKELGLNDRGQVGFYISNVCKGKENAILEKCEGLLEALLREFIRGDFSGGLEFTRNKAPIIYAGNLNWLYRLRQLRNKLLAETSARERIFKIYGDYGLNLNNVLGSGFAAQMGLDGWVPSLELYDEQLAMPIMVTEADLGMSHLVDRKKEKILVERRSFSDQNLLVSSGRIKEQNLYEYLKDSFKDENGIFRLYI